MAQLPRDVSAYLAKALKAVDWKSINGATPDLCSKCPQSKREVSDDNPVCLSCPWWGVLYSHMQAQHWRGGRHSRRIAKSQGDVQCHD